METDDIYRAGSFIQRVASSLWTDDDNSNSNEAFSREEDDEEALKWAALEKLPTYSRLKKGLLTTVDGGADEIDVDRLGFKQRKELVDRLVKVPQEDNENFLLKLRDRMDRVGINLPTTEVRFEHLNIEGEAHVGSRALTTFFNFFLSISESLLSCLHILPNGKKRISILKDVSGIIRPSQITLLLGPPGSGKTTLLKALAEKLDHSLKIAFALLDYVLIVKAIATEGQETNVITDYIIKILGLESCADIMVGNDMIRGISGGQRKRVTTGEMLVGPAKALFMDEISTGLDSSTTYQIVNSLKQYIHILDGTAVISLLQPPPETYDLFDNVILLSDGHVIYHGPRESVLEFFEHMGFKCPPRKGSADFLQEVTSRKDQQQYWMHRETPYRFVTTIEFAEAFQSFHVGRSLGQELLTPFDKKNSHPAALTTKRYGVGKMELFKSCFSRELLLMKRNSFVYIFKLSQLITMAIVAMTLFLRTEMHRDSITDGGIYLGALFYTVNAFLFNSMAEISMTIAKLHVYYKQRDFLFYPGWAFSLPPWILKFPITLIEAGAWVFLTYYVIGYDPNAGRLFKQYLLLCLISQMASALFRFIAASGRTMIVANTFGSFALLSLFASGGFVLSRENIKKWWIWGYWISPMMYGQNAIVANEFLGRSWSKFMNLIAFKKSQTIVLEDFQNDGVDKPGGIVELSNIEGGKARAGTSPTRKGMVLPFEPYCLTFDDIKYSVNMPQEMKMQGVVDEKLELLKGVSGAFRPGVLTALMGVSGAGKTTLMDVLAGRKTGGYIEGNITVSGYPKKQGTFARISGYCEQNDIHSPHVTVYESLLYSAWLRLPAEVKGETRKMFVEEVMDLVELKPLRQALVGLHGVNGLSTEQRKRLTIAVELVANPSIIFMDEPTSGLDARAAAIVMRTVRNTVDTGRTVVCTIHQPSIEIFEAFDELFLLKRGGQELYVGSLGHHSNHLINYFQAIEGVPRIIDGTNPANWMLEVTSSAQEMTLGIDFAAIYKNSGLYRRNKALIAELSTPAPDTKDLYFPSKYSLPFFTQCIACFWKQYLSYWRNPQYTAVRFLFTIAIALMFGTMFWDLGSKRSKRQDLFNAMGSMYAAVIFLGVQNASSVQPVVAIERSVFYRERSAGMYSPLPYAYAQVLIEIPYVFSQALVYGLLVYSMIGFEWTTVKFCWYIFFIYFTLLYFTYYGMMAVAVTPNHHIASIISSAFYSLWNLFSGFVVPRPRIPMWWRWYAWASPVAWTLYGLVGSQFGDVETTLLDTDERVTDFLRSYFGFRNDFLGVVAVVVVGFATLFAFIFAFSIKYFHFQRR
ncbi:unnamed protein product [Linum tenue]|uniref:ABC transporter domain-containing protein n=1 Tax=Linum tenue TaxID=586396 RepID=A0AAV0PT33_9ROSI|nr:unnamed protein product [Linum tenue]